MSRALIITGGLVSQIAAAGILQTDNLDAITAGPLVLGGAVATSVTLGANAACTSASLATGANVATLNIGTGAAAKTIQLGQGGGTPDTIEIGTPAGAAATIHLNGNVTIRGTEDVVGNTTFAEDVTLGDATNDAILIKGTLTFDGVSPGYMGGDIPFSANGGGTRALTIATAATSTGLTLSAGAASGAGNAGSNVKLVPGAPGAGGVKGSIVFGPTSSLADDLAYQILAPTNGGAATTWAGIRYAGLTARWEIQSNTGAWAPIATGYSIPAGTVTGDILQWSGAAWVNRTFTTLNNTAAIDIGHSAGDSQYAMSLHGQDAVAAATAGGNTTIRGGAGTTSGAGGSTTVRGGATATGTAGNLTLTGGNASGAGTGGNVIINGGTHVGGTHGNVLIAQDVLGLAYFGDGTNGIQYTASTKVMKAIGTGTIDLDTVGTSRLSFNGTLVTANAAITAANFLKLFDGSNVTTHTHGGLSASDVTVTTTGNSGTTNSVSYITAADDIGDARSNALATARAVGVKSGANAVKTNGLATTVPYEAGDPPTIGQPVFLSPSTAGSVQGTAPVTAGQFVVQLGICKAFGAGVCSIYLQTQAPLAL